ncbi:MAG: competence type IV pilus minor pilin ComGE [Lactovum sp.]
MENIKRKFNKAYILLESLITLSLLAMITSLMLTEINRSQEYSRQMAQEIESLNLAKMAIDKRVENLSANSVSVQIQKEEELFIVKDKNGEEILRLEIQEIQE